MTTPEPLTTQEINQAGVVFTLRLGTSPYGLELLSRLLYTARLGAKFVEMTKQEDFIILKRADK